MSGHGMGRTIESGGGVGEFFLAAGRLKTEPRRGWIKKLGMDCPESVADHSYRTVLIAMVYSDMKGLDTRKVMKMALLHDLPEAEVGDSTPGERPGDVKVALEDAAMTNLLRDLPSPISTEYGAIWREYLAGVSPEAALVRQVDKLELGIQAGEYKSKVGTQGHEFEEFFASARSGIKDLDMLLLLETLSGDA
jgi:5'-deoxynucleotidase